MTKEEIKKFINSFSNKQERTMVVVDYGNVEKWKYSLNWKVGIKELGQLVKNFSIGKKFLRRFYYGADYGKNEKSDQLIEWSRIILEKAEMAGFEVVRKRVKYIHSEDNKYGFEKKCDLDVEMAIDLVKERENYDTIILFSGDGDLMYAMKYLHDEYKKECYVFGARDHVGREVFDAKNEGVVKDILFAEDFEYRISWKKNSSFGRY
ncbi:MAG: NYN domain-containing protein [Candidatus Moranbacteria bacterium]|nr:NYN domain-containing protein [Candidatus Moranbacteria bacterium]